MNKEIKEIERILATSGKYITYAERCYLLDYITSLQEYYNDNVNKYEDLIVKYSNLQKENKIQKEKIEHLLIDLRGESEYKQRNKKQ